MKGGRDAEAVLGVSGGNQAQTCFLYLGESEMKKAILVLGLVGLFAASAPAVDYSWNAGAGAWTTGTNWTPTGVPGAGDNAIVQNSPSASAGSGASQTVTVGSLTVDNGAELGFGDFFTLNVGDYLYYSTNPMVGNNDHTFNIDGDVYFSQAYHMNWGFNNTWNLNGTNKAINFQCYNNGYDVMRWVNIYGSIYDNGSYRAGWSVAENTVTVKSGGQILARPGAVASDWVAREFIFEDGQANLPAINSDVDFYFRCMKEDNGTGNLTVAGGVKYPMDVYVGGGYWGGPYDQTSTYDWKIKGGDLAVQRDLQIRTNRSYAGDALGKWFHCVENGTNDPVSRNVTVGRDLVVGYYNNNNPATNWGKYGMKMYNATVRVGRDLNMGYGNESTGTLQMDNATIYLGDDLDFKGVPIQWAIDNWQAGTSTLICDGNGVAYSYSQTLEMMGDCGIKWHNLHINNPGGTVTLAAGAAGDTILTGDLKVLAGTFNDSDRPITFNGDQHLLEVAAGATITGGSFDNLVLLDDAVLNLGSDILTDNLAMGDGSRIYLNSLYELQADGFTYDGLTDSGPGGAGPWPNDLGMIYPGAIPEPGTLLLVGTGVLGVLGYIRRRRMT